MWELLLALDLVQRHMKRTFEPDPLVKPIQPVRGEQASGAPAPSSGSPRGLERLAPRRQAA
jgi:hypothetical protein